MTFNINAFDLDNAEFEHNLLHFSAGYITGAVMTKIVDIQYSTYVIVYSDQYMVGSYCQKIMKKKDFWYYFYPMIAVVSVAFAKEATDSQFNFQQFGYSVLGGTLGMITISW
jgi:hypothetical protein